MCQEGRHCVTDLTVLISASAFKEVIVRECLYPCSFPHSPTSALCRIVMDERVAVLCDMARHRGGLVRFELHPKPVVEITMTGTEGIFYAIVLWKQHGRKIMKLGRTSRDSGITGRE
jgi:hypothetical protein